MRKKLLTMSMIITFLITGGTSAISKDISSSKTSKYSESEVAKLNNNKKIALGVSYAIMKGEWDKVDELLDEKFTYEGDGAPQINKQQYIGFMKNVLSSSMTNMDMKFLRVIAEGDFVAVDYTNEMTNSGSFYGMPATGKRVLATGMFIREVKNGKVIAEWQTTNAIGLMKQLGENNKN